MSAAEYLNQLSSNVKVAVGVVVTTTGTSIGDILEIIPDDIGKLGIVIGVILSSILIPSHLISLVRNNTGRKKEQLELKMMEEGYEERRKKSRQG